MEKQQHKYIFPNPLAQAMSKVDLRTQYEASMMSMSLMSIGLILTTIYAWVYLDLKLWFKIVMLINSAAGLVFLWSFVITTFQQYKNYMGILDFQKDDVKGGTS